MKKICMVISVLLFAANFSWAYDVDKWNKVAAIPCYQVNQDSLAIFEKPDLSSDVLALLTYGDTVTILNAPDIAKQDEAWNWWYTVRFYDKEGSRKTGYIASSDHLRNDSYKFGATIFTLRSKDGPDGLGKVALWALSTDGGMQRQLAELTCWFEPVLSIKSGRGLDNVQLIISIVMLYEGGTEHFFAWNGEKLIPLPSASYGYPPDGDCRDEYVLFPADGMPGNTIIKVVGESEECDFMQDLNYQYATIMYHWDGEKAVPIIQNSSIIEENAK